MTDDQIELEVFILVDRMGDPLMEHIKKSVPYPATVDVVRRMVKDGYLRMKEDDIDHDWSYRITDRGEQRWDFLHYQEHKP